MQSVYSYIVVKQELLVLTNNWQNVELWITWTRIQLVQDASNFVIRSEHKKFTDRTGITFQNRVRVVGCGKEKRTVE